MKSQIPDRKQQTLFLKEKPIFTINEGIEADEDDSPVKPRSNLRAKSSHQVCRKLASTHNLGRPKTVKKTGFQTPSNFMYRPIKSGCTKLINSHMIESNPDMVYATSSDGRPSTTVSQYKTMNMSQNTAIAPFSSYGQNVKNT